MAKISCTAISFTQYSSSMWVQDTYVALPLAWLVASSTIDIPFSPSFVVRQPSPQKKRYSGLELPKINVITCSICVRVTIMLATTSTIKEGHITRRHLFTKITKYSLPTKISEANNYTFIILLLLCSLHYPFNHCMIYLYSKA